MSDHDRTITPLSNDSIPRLRAVLASARARGCSLKSVLARLEAAAEGRLRTRKFEQAEVDLAVLALRLGGRRMAFILHQALGLPSVSFLYEHGALASFHPLVRRGWNQRSNAKDTQKIRVVHRPSVNKNVTNVIKYGMVVGLVDFV